MGINNKTTNDLFNISAQYPREEKVIIVNDYFIGHQLLEGLTKSGNSWINFNIATVNSLAHDLAEEHIATNGIELITGIKTNFIIETIFNELADTSNLKYFKKLPMNTGLIEGLSQAIQDLRLIGIKAKDLMCEHFIDPDKGNDMIKLISGYEDYLKVNNLADKAGLIFLAQESLQKPQAQSDRKYIITSRHYMRGIERAFIDKFTKGNLIVIGNEDVYGLTPPPDIWAGATSDTSDTPKSDIERLKWLFESRNAPTKFGDNTIALFSAIGSRNEIREVFRRLLKDKIKTDETELIYTNAEAYQELIYSICEKLNIPATFSDGIPPHLLVSGRALKGFLLWLRSGFEEIYLRRLIESGSLKFQSADDDTLNKMTDPGFLLRTSGVGWGRERYAIVLAGRIKKLKESARKKKNWDEEEAVRLEKEAADFSTLKSICEEILEIVPIETEQKVDFTQLCNSCINFIEKHININTSNDKDYTNKAIDKIRMLGKSIKQQVSFEEGTEKLINLISNIQASSSGPRPGHIHVAHFKKGGNSGRQNTFIVGLDEGKFPQKTALSSILLDEEKKKISSDLELTNEHLKKTVYDMACLISGCRGRITLSYSPYDIKDERNAFPSSILLQVYRIKEGNPEADYNTLLSSIKDVASFGNFPKGLEVDETDWWLNNLMDGLYLKTGLESAKAFFPGIEDGLVAEAARRTNPKLTRYDGKIKGDPKELDPRLSQQVLSASAIESAAGCLYKYFLQRLLGVSAPEERELDYSMWLDARDKGTLLHEVFEQYFKELQKLTKPTEEQKKSLALKMLDEEVKKATETIPSPSKAILDNECLQLKRDIEVFLEINKKLGTEPIACEYWFNKVKIPLSEDQHILLKGFIDRVDSVKEDEFSIWDYKTGRSKADDENIYISGGKELQFILYSIAAIDQLKNAKLIKGKEIKDPKINISGYLHPTEKGTKEGKGNIIPRKPFKNDTWKTALQTMFDLMASGMFFFNFKNNVHDCSYCDFKAICGNEKTKENFKVSKKSESNDECARWEELKALK